MTRQDQNRLDCSQFEALLAEALDSEGIATSLMAADTRNAFEFHRLSCAICGPLYEEAKEGMLALRSLAEVEPPRNLIHNILAATSLADQASKAAASAGTAEGWLKRWQAALVPSFAGLMRSRFATSFAMAFFSLSLTLTLSGVKIADIGKIDWHPSALRRSVVLQYSEMEASVMRYYDNARLVYTVRNTVRGLRNASAPAEQKNETKPQQKRTRPAPDTSGQPDRHEDYSVQRDGTLLAKNTMKSEGAKL